MHADFMSGWEQETLQRAVNECHSSSGRIEDCHVFTIQDKSVYEGCKIELPDSLASENVTGPLSSLPGGVHILQPGEAEKDDTDSPAMAAAGVDEPDVDDAPPSSSEVAKEVATEVAAEVPAEVPIEVSTEVSEQSTTSLATPPETTAEDPTITEPPSLTDEDVSYAVISTEYKTEGNVVYEIVWEEAWVYVTEDVTTTVTVSTGARSMRRAKRGHFHNHFGGHHHRH